MNQPEMVDLGPFEVLQNPQDFTFVQHNVQRCVPRLAVQATQWPAWGMHAAVGDLGPGKGLVPGCFCEEVCRVSWGGCTHTLPDCWVMCWPDVLPIIRDGFFLRKAISAAAAQDEQICPGSSTCQQQSLFLPSR